MALLRRGAQDTASGILQVGEGGSNILSGVTAGISFGGHLAATGFKQLAKFVGGSRKSPKKRSPKRSLKSKSRKIKYNKKSPKKKKSLKKKVNLSK
jgi:hypothetical protein